MEFTMRVILIIFFIYAIEIIDTYNEPDYSNNSIKSINYTMIPKPSWGWGWGGAENLVNWPV